MKIFFNVIKFSAISLFCLACSKGSSGGTNPEPVDTTSTIKPQVDPPISGSIGFFLNDWQQRSFSKPSTSSPVTPPATASYNITVDYSNVITKIPPSIAGNNANSWMGDMINESSLLDYLTMLHPHIIRFPGGSISDAYFWNSPKNLPPADAPAQLVKADGTSAASGFWYGKNTESWTISIDKYYQMLNLTGNQGVITINYGYARYGMGSNPVAAAAHLAADWVRYDNGRTKYWEIGNECFGDWEAGYRINLNTNKDGQPEVQTGLLYGQHFKVFADSMRKAAQEIGKAIYIGAVTYEAPAESWSSNTVKTWNSGLFTGAGNSADYYVIHSYYTPYNTNSNADVILNSATTVTANNMAYVKQSIANAGLPLKPIVMDEWNIFSTGSRQQVSHVNGMHALMILGESIKNQFGMTCRWDLANAWSNGDDHGMFNIGDEPGVPKWNPRPAFYHMYFFQKNLGDRMIASTSSSSEILSYASSFSSGEASIAMVNKGTTSKNVEIKIDNFKKGQKFYWYTLVGGDENGEFSGKVFINNISPTNATGGPLTYKTIAPMAASVAEGIRVLIPARAVVILVVEKG